MHYHNLREKILKQVNLVRSDYARRPTLPEIVPKEQARDLELDASECSAAREHAKWLALQHKKVEADPKTGQELSLLSHPWLVESPQNLRSSWHEMVAYRETTNKPHDGFLELVRDFFYTDATGTRRRFLLAAEGKMAVGFGLRRLGRKKTALYLCLRLKRSRSR